MTKLKQVNLKVDPGLWQKARVDAIKMGVDLKDWVAEAIQEKLRNHRKGGAEK